MAKKRTNKNRKQVKRQTRHFQLRVEHPIDQHVREVLDYKRANRSEVTTIRDGVRLIWALENNDLSVLYELFPHLKQQLGSGGAGGGDSDTGRIAAMLELFMAEQKQSNGYVMQSALPAPAAPTPATTGKLLSGFKPLAPPPPVEDDLDDLLEFTASTQHTASDNFMRMLGSLS